MTPHDVLRNVWRFINTSCVLIIYEAFSYYYTCEKWRILAINWIYVWTAINTSPKEAGRKQSAYSSSKAPFATTSGSSSSRIATSEIADTEATGMRSLKFGSEMLDRFDPDHSYTNIERWLHKIDQLGAVSDRSNYEKATLAQSKKRWFFQLEEYHYS